MSDTDFLAELRRPFTAAAVKIKPQVVTKDQTKGLVTFYIDSRLLVERLNAVVGWDKWSDEYRLLVEGQQTVAVGLPVECSLTVDGVTKTDVGQLPPGEMDDKAWKSAYSDAFKRAGVKFGVGAFLYNLPNIWAETKIGDKGKAVGFSDAGARMAKQAYAKWLASPANIYGQPLDHGDTEDSGSGAEPASTGSPDRGEQALGGRESAPGITEAQLSTIAELVPSLATLRGTTTEAVTTALSTDNGPLTELSQSDAAALIGKLQRWKTNLEASAGESPQSGADGSSSDGEANGGTAQDAPAETPFKAPTGPRGGKRKAAA